MDEEDRQHAETLFHQAVDMPPEDRPAFLDTACTDRRIREEVESLLAHLGSSRLASLQSVDALDKEDAELVGERVGPYRLLELIGEGGFGAVYLAHQERPIKRKVAVKVVKLGMDTKQVVARFEVERQALALMEHPNIAHVYDAGSTESGRPYFAMELVQGVPLTEFCDANRLATRDRLRLLVQVCRGVQHAHQKGIIHRDIKPSNVLVMLHDGVPVPKIIDFGIAKAMSESLTNKTMFTGFRQFVGTREYVSPEQAEMSGLDIDTRSDIYSLGVLMYELLTGMTPFDPRLFRSATYAEMQRIICEQDPVTPSRRVSALGADLSVIANARRAEPRLLRKLIKGDLDWIVMRALEKDRNRRYETAAAMADDIQRHLEDEPVSAGPPSVLYRLRKSMVRHKTAAGFVMMLFTVVLAFGTWMTLLYAEAEQERHAAEANLLRAQVAEDHARTEAKTASQVAQILAGLFEVADPFRAEGGATTARQILDDGADQVRRQLAEQPETQAALLDTIGRVYVNLGLFSNAEPVLRRALELRRADLGDSHPETIASMDSLGAALMYDHKFSEAEPLLRQAVDMGRRVLGPEHLVTVNAVAHLSWILQSAGRWREAEPLCRQALAVYRREFGDDHPRTVTAINALSWLLCCLTDFEEAETLAREGLESTVRTLGEESVRAAESMNVLGVLLLHRRKVDQAARFIRQAEAIRRRLLGGQHPDTLESIENVAHVLMRQGVPEQAEERYRESLAGYRRIHGQDHRRVFRSMCCLGGAISAQGRYAEAEPLFREGLAGLQCLAGVTHHETVSCLQGFASALSGQGKLGEHAQAFHEAHALYRRVLGAKDPRTIRSRVIVGLVLHDQEQWVEAEAWLRETLAVIQEESSSLACPGCLTGVATSLVGNCLAGQGRQEEAEQLLLAGYSTLVDAAGPYDDTTLDALARIAQFYDSHGQSERAEAWRAKIAHRRR